MKKLIAVMAVSACALCACGNVSVKIPTPATDTGYVEFTANEVTPAETTSAAAKTESDTTTTEAVETGGIVQLGKIPVQTTAVPSETETKTTTTVTTSFVPDVIPTVYKVTEPVYLDEPAPIEVQTVALPQTQASEAEVSEDYTMQPAPMSEDYGYEGYEYTEPCIENYSYQYSADKVVLDYPLYYDYWIGEDGLVHFVNNGVETYTLTYQDFVLICNCVAYEYGNMDYVPYYERSLVVETIMNRYWDWGYDSIYDVITYPNAFTNSWLYADMTDFLPQVGQNVFDAVGVYFCNFNDPNYYNEGYYYYWGDGIWNYFSVEWHGLWLPPEDM